MADVKWIKITTDIFDDEKILLIESLPDAYAIITVWFKLLCLAGKQNNSGVFMMGRIPYTDKMLATIFRMKETTVTMALRTFEEFGMVEIVDGVITIPNWGKHQNLEQLEERRKYQREYQREYRKKQKLLTSGEDDKESKHLHKHLHEPNVNTLEEDIEEDIEEDKERDTEEDNNTVSNDTVCCTRNVQRVVDAWNSLGLTRIRTITDNTDRSTWLKKRIKDYGLESVLEAIENIRESDFLMGRTKEGFNITFDWFIRPNNFPKVLDGNYENRKGNGQTTQASGRVYHKQTKAEELNDFYDMAGAWANK